MPDPGLEPASPVREARLLTTTFYTFCIVSVVVDSILGSVTANQGSIASIFTAPTSRSDPVVLPQWPSMGYNHQTLRFMRVFSSAEQTASLE